MLLCYTTSAIPTARLAFPMLTCTAWDRYGALRADVAVARRRHGCARAQTPPPAPDNARSRDVTATRGMERLFDVPASADVIDGRRIRDGQPAINLSESLVRVPGVFAANRNNYAQDLQLSSRGYGARAAFGVRGVRLYQDDIPATMPDGQGQTGSFSLLSAKTHRSAARALFHAVRQCVRRRGIGLHGGWHGRAGGEFHRQRRQLWHVDGRRQGHRHRRTASVMSPRSATSTPTAIANTHPRCARSPTRS